MHFRELGNGEYFPPIIPNGRFIAVPRAGYPMQEIFQVRDEGLFARGVFLLWQEIAGIVLDGQRCMLASSKYPSRVGFLIGRCEHHMSCRCLTMIQSYPVEYCLMNRITLERQQRDTARGQ